MKIDIIAGARPNFIKIAPIIREINKQIKLGINLKFRLIHTGQHYDKNMSEFFFNQLNIPIPDINFDAGGGSQAEQTSKIMIKYESLLKNTRCDLCLVVGDVTSTMACSIVAKKMNIKVAHVEGGIRSFDLTMPEEINRIVTDSISDFFYTTSPFANENLKSLGFKNKSIIYVGNTMIDTLIYEMDRFKKPFFYEKLKLSQKKYFVLTLHRPSNVDSIEIFLKIITEILKNTKDYPVIYPAHPRVKGIISKLKKFNNLNVVDPIPYLEFNYLVKNSLCVITDSGGITEEATVMDVPCMTVRNNTERPETISEGTNELIGTNPKKFKLFFELLFNNNWKKGSVPKFWDGKASERIVKHLISID
tara:strand:+ start:23829 stop:24914 length:1086 start_codon:yes stop_codon:yes gene_type:complete